MSDESDDSDEDEFDKLGSEYGSNGTYSTGLGGLLCSLGFLLGVNLSDDGSYDSDGGSLALPYKSIGEARTGECTGNANIFSITQISAESWIDPMFVESSGIG